MGRRAAWLQPCPLPGGDTIRAAGRDSVISACLHKAGQKHLKRVENESMGFASNVVLWCYGVWTTWHHTPDISNCQRVLWRGLHEILKLPLLIGSATELFGHLYCSLLAFSVMVKGCCNPSLQPLRCVFELAYCAKGKATASHKGKRSESTVCVRLCVAGFENDGIIQCHYNLHTQSVDLPFSPIQPFTTFTWT